MALLITGGCGYIGSNIAVVAALQGRAVVVLDRAARVPKIFATLNIAVVQGDCGDALLISSLCTKYSIVEVIHCAALIDVAESSLVPSYYYDGNVARSIMLMNQLIAHGISRIIFSSSCAVYGIPSVVPIPVDHPRNPISPYGRTKLAIEWYLEDSVAANSDLHGAVLRYFNAAGGSPEWGLAECHIPESHLIPRVISAVRDGASIMIYGGDYDTPDGTAIRDYLHVKDLAAAHLVALDLLSNQKMLIANLGTGVGYSVMEIIESVERFSGRSLNRTVLPRRAGDPPRLIANVVETERLFSGWSPRHSSLDEIIESAYH